METNELEEQL